MILASQTGVTQRQAPQTRAPQRLNNQRGFTLVEMLVVMAIFALIGLASYQVVSTMIDTETNSAKAQEKLERLQSAMFTIERDLRYIVPRAVRGLELQGTGTEMDGMPFYLISDGEMLDSEQDGLGFIRGSWTNPGNMFPRSELQPVIYRLRENRLERLSYPYVDQIANDPTITVLLDDVTELSFRFVGERAVNRQELNWLNDWQFAGTLPYLIEIRVVSEQFGEIVRVIAPNGGRFEESSS